MRGAVARVGVAGRAAAPLAAPALATLGAHLLVAGRYGYFRDELYYLAAGRHPAAGYVEFPPFVAALAALVARVAPGSLVALHVPPALAAAGLVLLTGLLARELGGGRFAQGLAGLASLANIGYRVTGALFSMDVWDQLWWTLAAYLVIRLLARGRPRLWLLVGAVAGLGLLTKLTMLLFGLGLAAGLLLSPARAHLRARWVWLGGLVAAAGLVPYALWNAAHGWPTPAFWGHYGTKVAGGSAPDFLLQQVITMNPLTLPLWLAGLWWLLWAPAGRPYRALGWAYLVLLALLAAVHAKSYFLAPAYTWLYAAGALVAEGATRARPWRRARPLYAAVLLLSGLLFAPFALPILPPATTARYYGGLAGGGLPQWLGDRLGWDELTAAVAGVRDGLPPDERAAACVLTANYGEAGAIDLLGPARGLPPAISGHNNYWLWGPGACSGQVVIAVGVPPGELAALFDAVTPAGAVPCTACMPEERGAPLTVCRQPRGWACVDSVDTRILGTMFSERSSRWRRRIHLIRRPSVPRRSRWPGRAARGSRNSRRISASRNRRCAAG
jgi:hypothetical protein